MLHYYLSQKNGSLITQGFVCTLEELSQVLLYLRVDFHRYSFELEELNSIICNRTAIFANPGDCIVTTSLTLELL